MTYNDAEYEAIQARYDATRKLAHAEARHQLAEELARQGVAQPKPRKPRMKTRHARLIRKGILAARDPELRQYVHLAPRLVREAARREAVRIEDRELRATLTAMKAERDPEGWGWFLRFYIDHLIRRMTPKPIPDTFKAAPTPPEVFVIPSWQKHQSESATRERISAAVAREMQNQQRFGRFYA